MAPNLVLAPIRGVTDAVYRGAFAGVFGGFDRALAPFIPLKQAAPMRSAELRQVSPERNRALSTIPQLLTNHPPSFRAALDALAAAGHGEVNWNLACPTPQTAGRGRGAGLLPHPERIDAILREVHVDIPVRLSVKMRLGDENPDEFFAVLDVLGRYPLAEVILHPRTAAQAYGGKVDLDRAARALERCLHPFCFSGDLVDVQTFRATQARLPAVSAWMLGRGALANPFLPSLIKGVPFPSVEVRRKKLLEFHGLLFEGYRRLLSGPRHLMDRMTQQWEYLAQSFGDPLAAKQRIRRCGDLDGYQRSVGWIFAQPLATCGAQEP